MSVLPEMMQILQLEEWHHPNVVDEKELPSVSETFQQLAQVLASGDVRAYRPKQAPNTHWRNWPEGGRLQTPATEASESNEEILEALQESIMGIGLMGIGIIQGSSRFPRSPEPHADWVS
jgi:hypothetical protein